MRLITTLNLATWAAAATLYFAPLGISQLETFALPKLNRVPEPATVLADMRKELKDSRASVIRAVDVTYEQDASEFGVLLPNPPDARQSLTDNNDWPVSAK